MFTLRDSLSAVLLGASPANSSTELQNNVAKKGKKRNSNNKKKKKKRNPVLRAESDETDEDSVNSEDTSEQVVVVSQAADSTSSMVFNFENNQIDDPMTEMIRKIAVKCDAHPDAVTECINAMFDKDLRYDDFATVCAEMATFRPSEGVLLKIQLEQQKQEKRVPVLWAEQESDDDFNDDEDDDEDGFELAVTSPYAAANTNGARPVVHNAHNKASTKKIPSEATQATKSLAVTSSSLNSNKKFVPTAEFNQSCESVGIAGNNNSGANIAVRAPSKLAAPTDVTNNVRPTVSKAATISSTTTVKTAKAATTIKTEPQPQLTKTPRERLEYVASYAATNLYDALSALCSWASVTSSTKGNNGHPADGTRCRDSENVEDAVSKMSLFFDCNALELLLAVILSDPHRQITMRQDVKSAMQTLLQHVLLLQGNPEGTLCAHYVTESLGALVNRLTEVRTSSDAVAVPALHENGSATALLAKQMAKCLKELYFQLKNRTKDSKGSSVNTTSGSNRIDNSNNSECSESDSLPMQEFSVQLRAINDQILQLEKKDAMQRKKDLDNQNTATAGGTDTRGSTVSSDGNDSGTNTTTLTSTLFALREMQMDKLQLCVEGVNSVRLPSVSVIGSGRANPHAKATVTNVAVTKADKRSINTNTAVKADFDTAIVNSTAAIEQMLFKENNVSVGPEGAYIKYRQPQATVEQVDRLEAERQSKLSALRTEAAQCNARIRELSTHRENLLVQLKTCDENLSKLQTGLQVTNARIAETDAHYQRQAQQLKKSCDAAQHSQQVGYHINTLVAAVRDIEVKFSEALKFQQLNVSDPCKVGSNGTSSSRANQHDNGTNVTTIITSIPPQEQKPKLTEAAVQGLRAERLVLLGENLKQYAVTEAKCIAFLCNRIDTAQRALGTATKELLAYHALGMKGSVAQDTDRKASRLTAEIAEDKQAVQHLQSALAGCLENGIRAIHDSNVSNNTSGTTIRPRGGKHTMVEPISHIMKTLAPVELRVALTDSVRSVIENAQASGVQVASSLQSIFPVATPSSSDSSKATVATTITADSAKQSKSHEKTKLDSPAITVAANTSVTGIPNGTVNTTAGGGGGRTNKQIAHNTNKTTAPSSNNYSNNSTHSKLTTNTGGTGGSKSREHSKKSSVNVGSSTVNSSRRGKGTNVKQTHIVDTANAIDILERKSAGKTTSTLPVAATGRVTEKEGTAVKQKAALPTVPTVNAWSTSAVKPVESANQQSSSPVVTVSSGSHVNGPSKGFLEIQREQQEAAAVKTNREGGGKIKNSVVNAPVSKAAISTLSPPPAPKNIPTSPLVEYSTAYPAHGTSPFPETAVLNEITSSTNPLASKSDEAVGIALTTRADSESSNSNNGDNNESSSHSSKSMSSCVKANPLSPTRKAKREAAGAGIAPTSNDAPVQASEVTPSSAVSVVCHHVGTDVLHRGEAVDPNNEVGVVGSEVMCSKDVITAAGHVVEREHSNNDTDGVLGEFSSTGPASNFENKGVANRNVDEYDVTAKIDSTNSSPGTGITGSDGVTDADDVSNGDDAQLA